MSPPRTHTALRTLAPAIGALIAVLTIALGLLPAGCAAPADAARPAPVAPSLAPRLSPTADAPAHLTLARAILADLAPENTRYQHRPSIVEPATADRPARALTDCSGLLNALFTRSLGLTESDLSRWLAARRPLARHYFAAIEASRGFEPVPTIADIRAGDVLASRYPDGSDNTGHTMLADAPAQRREPSPPLIEGTTQWTLAIIDATSSPHGGADTRAAQRRSGLGRGEIRLYADASGAIAGYTWSAARSSVYRPRNERPLLVGRVDPDAVRSLTDQPAQSSAPPTPARD